MRYLDEIDSAIGIDHLGDKDSIFDRLVEVPPERVIELAINLADNLPKPIKRLDHFRFAANSALSGSPYPCHEARCRLENTLQAANFCALYSNEFVLFNPMESTLSELHSSDIDVVSFIDELSTAISIILLLRPLIDRGMCTFIETHKYRFCNECFAKGLSAANSQRNDLNIYFALIRDFNARTTITYDGIIDGKKSFTVRGEPDLLGHEDGGILFDKTSIKKRFKKGAVLDPVTVADLGIGRSYAFYSTNDIVRTNDASHKYGLDSIIGTQAQFDIVNYAVGNNVFGQETYITYPLLAARQIQSALSFRDQEWHHLVDFRNFISQAIESGGNVQRELDSELAKLEHITSKARRASNKKVVSDVAGLAVTAAAAVASAGVSHLISAILGVLGGGHLTKNMATDIIERLQGPDEALDSKVYYAWKARRRLDN